MKTSLNLVSVNIYNKFSILKHWNKEYFVEIIDNYTQRSVVFTRSIKTDVIKQFF